MNIKTANKNSIEEAANLIKSGKLVAFPTETVYGVGADATNDMAIAEIFAVKNRPQFNPLIIHIASIEMAKSLVQWNELAEQLANVFWAGPLTFILPKLANSPIAKLASAGGDTVGIRMPQNEIALALCNAAGVPIAAPSANRSGRVSTTSADLVYKELGDNIPLILDGGVCKVGIESTVLDLTSDKPTILRQGFVTEEELERVLNKKIHIANEVSGTLKSPGMTLSHYSPSLPVRLNVIEPLASEALIAFGNDVPEGAKFTINLSKNGDLKEAAANLFSALHKLDKQDFSAIAVMPIPNFSIGVAINDRLKRAAY